jgi:hypothetical protein
MFPKGNIGVVRSTTCQLTQLSSSTSQAMSSHPPNDDCPCGTHKNSGIVWAKTSIITPGGTKLQCAIEIGAFKHLIGYKTLEQYFPGSRKIGGEGDTTLEHKASRYLKALTETRDFAWLEYGLEDEGGNVVTWEQPFDICKDDEPLGMEVILGGQKLAEVGLIPCFNPKHESMHLDNVKGPRLQAGKSLLETDPKDWLSEASKSSKGQEHGETPEN